MFAKFRSKVNIICLCENPADDSNNDSKLLYMFQSINELLLMSMDTDKRLLYNAHDVDLKYR